MDEKMTLEQVRYVAGSIRAAWCKKPEVCAARCDEAANMLEALAHLAQPAQAVDVGAIREVIAYLKIGHRFDMDMADKLTRAIGNAQAEGS